MPKWVFASITGASVSIFQTVGQARKFCRGTHPLSMLPVYRNSSRLVKQFPSSIYLLNELNVTLRDKYLVEIPCEDSVPRSYPGEAVTSWGEAKILFGFR
jgi:hypothetical protein